MEIRQACQPGGCSIPRLARGRVLRNASAANDLPVCGNAPITAPYARIVAGTWSHVPSMETGDPHAGLLSKRALHYSSAFAYLSEIFYGFLQSYGWLRLDRNRPCSVCLCDRPRPGLRS